MAHKYQEVADMFGIKPEDVDWYHSGICYNRIHVKTQEAADAVTKKVDGQTANGGILHGAPLGGQTKQLDGTIEVYC